MRAVIIEHEEHEGPGLLGDELKAAGFQQIKRYRQVKREDMDAELVVVLGGTMGVYETDLHPFLSAEIAFLAERLSLDRPVLGICLGAQLMAAAVGANVFKGKNGLEIGVGPVRWTKAAQEDPVLKVGPKSVVAHWHGDTYEPVPEATLLASTDRYTQQGFRLGKSYALQFHLELSAKELGNWLTHEERALSELGQDVTHLRASLGKLQAAEVENRRILERLVHHFKRAG